MRVRVPPRLLACETASRIAFQTGFRPFGAYRPCAVQDEQIERKRTKEDAYGLIVGQLSRRLNLEISFPPGQALFMLKRSPIAASARDSIGAFTLASARDSYPISSGSARWKSPNCEMARTLGDKGGG